MPQTGSSGSADTTTSLHAAARPCPVPNPEHPLLPHLVDLESRFDVNALCLYDPIRPSRPLVSAALCGLGYPARTLACGPWMAGPDRPLGIWGGASAGCGRVPTRFTLLVKILWNFSRMCCRLRAVLAATAVADCRCRGSCPGLAHVISLALPRSRRCTRSASSCRFRGWSAPPGSLLRPPPETPLLTRPAPAHLALLSLTSH
jgi:hypothetical protein